MKTRLYFLALILTFIGFCTSCHKAEDDADIDMSSIDFSNIDNLYEQPLPVIQKCVEGKWKWVASFGGNAGVSSFENTYVDIEKDYISMNNGRKHVYYTWKRYNIHNMDDGKYNSWVIWNIELNRGIWYFDSIKNDTLQVGHVNPANAEDVPYKSEFERVK